jgi:hypothetical protein
VKKCPQKVKTKKLFSNFAESHFFRFLIFYYFGGHFDPTVYVQQAQAAVQSHLHLGKEWWIEQSVCYQLV